MLRESKNCLAYTGAGISTASGIHDYATQSKKSQAQLNRPKLKSPLDAKPTLAHRVLAELYQQKHLKYWVQQNHDGLPQKAGLPQSAINEIHGAWYDPSNPIVMMDGNLREDLFKSLLEWERKCDLCLVIGTSLSGMNADRLCQSLGRKAKQGVVGKIGTVIVSIQEHIEYTSAPYGYLPILRYFDDDACY
eukprot:TRINITY_DN3443_c0_g1_i1.p1 TRINITY_DN3443_c0_g1~~TRINITY_DN3443_c0_g1_i1.p1  ORF type:complete len:191 (-),score=24.95 TRINITY_DN3443_c0_g1_i1:50-622(-)